MASPEASGTASTSCLATDAASGGWAASRSASASARGSASPAGATSVTSPIAAARSALKRSPSRISSFARAVPSSRVSRSVPPELGTMPIATSGNPNVAPASATRKSIAPASSSPPPMQ